MLNDPVFENLQNIEFIKDNQLVNFDTLSNNEKNNPHENDDKIEERLLSIVQKYSNMNEEADDNRSFKKLRKLKKTKLIEKEKKINKLISLNTFFEYEAELGSDNEEHDNIIKKVKDDDDNDLDDEFDEDLKDLIDENELAEDEQNIQEKYFDDMLEKDKEELKKVIKGPPNRLKRARNEYNYDNDHIPLNHRMKKFKSNDDNLLPFNHETIFRNLESLQKKINEDNEDNEELKEMYQAYEDNYVKKIAQQFSAVKKEIGKRIKENNSILENVINLNCTENADTKKDNLFFQKGTIKNTSAISHINMLKYGYKFNKNSVLYAMKNDKYYRHDVEYSQGSNLSNSTNESNQSIAEKNVTNFSANFNMKNSINCRTMNLSSLFKGNEICKGIDEKKRIDRFNSSGKKKNSLKRILN